MSTEIKDITKFVFENMENFYGVTLTDREKQFAHVYYGMLSLALEEEREYDESDVLEEINTLQDSWDELMESEYTHEDVCDWATLNVDTLFDLLRQENEVADMYRGLE